jgi:hypothetical protein
LRYARMRRNAAGRRVRRPLVARRETRERIGKRKRTPLWQGPALSFSERRRNTDRPQFETAANSLENRYRYALRYGWQNRSGTSGDRNTGDAGGNAAASRPGEAEGLVRNASQLPSSHPFEPVASHRAARRAANGKSSAGAVADAPR